LGLRLFRTGAIDPVQGGKVGSAFAAEVRAEAVGGPATSGALPVTGSAPPIVEADPAMPAYPLVRVVNRSKQTTHEQPKETYHAFWTVDYGDGGTQRIDGSPELRLSHAYKREGAFVVLAQSFDNYGEPLLTKSWKVNISGDGDATREFSCRSIPRAVPNLILSGPVMWVTGKPAVYSAALTLDAGPDAEVVSVEFDPGPKFCVLWERSGDFQVSCAATARLRYLIDGETFSLENTYLTECTVSVLTTGVTR
jgi:hypothetical protein